MLAEKKFSPFKPGEVIAESKNSLVTGYPDFHLVTKEWLADSSVVFTNVGDVQERIHHLKEDIKNIQDNARAKGVDPNLFMPNDFVIHANEDGQIVYSRVQERIEGGKTLASERGKFITYPSDTLRQLKDIFTMNLEAYATNRSSIDLPGSNVKTKSSFMRVLQFAFPLFYSTNILIDKHKNVYHADFEILSKNSDRLSVKRKKAIPIEAIGSVISIGIIESVLLARRMLRMP